MDDCLYWEYNKNGYHIQIRETKYISILIQPKNRFDDYPLTKEEAKKLKNLVIKKCCKKRGINIYLIKELDNCIWKYIGEIGYKSFTPLKIYSNGAFVYITFLKTADTKNLLNLTEKEWANLWDDYREKYGQLKTPEHILSYEDRWKITSEIKWKINLENPQNDPFNDSPEWGADLSGKKRKTKGAH